VLFMIRCVAADWDRNGSTIFDSYL